MSQFTQDWDREMRNNVELQRIECEQLRSRWLASNRDEADDEATRWTTYVEATKRHAELVSAARADGVEL
jgi:hypothetical protein